MPQRPNVIMIVADDMGYGDFGRFNDGYVRTPYLDRLIDESVCLTQQYTGSPVCSPSRAALLTGRYPHRTGAITPQEVRGLDRIALGEVTLGDTFKHGGYVTGMVGKWHKRGARPSLSTPTRAATTNSPASEGGGPTITSGGWTLTGRSSIRTGGTLPMCLRKKR